MAITWRDTQPGIRRRQANAEMQWCAAVAVTVGKVKASKEVDFTVQQAPDGKLTVSVEPFQF